MEGSQVHKESHFFQGLYPQGFRPYRIRKFDIIIALLLFVLTSLAYIKNLTPSVTAGDSGELTTAVYNMGACHPPGFPLYGIVGKLFTFIPVGDIGYRVNLFSAISAAGAILFFYLILIKLLGLNRDQGRLSLAIHLPAIAGSIAFAFTRTLWSQAVIGEVYALNTFLIAFMVYIMLLWYEELVNFRKEEKPHFAERLTFLLAFAMGLSLTNHQLPVWYIVGFMVFLVPITVLIIAAQHSPRLDLLFKGKSGGLISPFNTAIAAGTAFLLLSFLVLPQFSGASLLVGVGAFAIAVLTLFSRIHDDPDSSFAAQMRERMPVIAIFVVLAVVSVVLFVAFAYLSPMVYPKDMKWIWLSIFLMPVSLSVYTLYARKKHKEANWVDDLLYLLTIGFWLLIFAISIYLYLRVRAMSLAPLSEPKPLSWGDTRSFDVLINHMLRKQYGRPGGNLNNYFGQLKAVLDISLQQFHWVNSLLVLAGLVYMFFREKVWAFFTLMTMSLFTVIMIKFVNFEVDPRTLSFQEVMYIQSFMFMVIYLSFGYQLLLDFFPLLQKWKQQRAGKK